MKKAETMIVFHGCLFDATRIGAEGRIASRLYFEVRGPDASGRTLRVDVVQADDVPYGEGEVEVAWPEDAATALDRGALAGLAARYYRMVAADFRADGGLAGRFEERARDVIISRTWKAPLDES